MRSRSPMQAALVTEATKAAAATWREGDGGFDVYTQRCFIFLLVAFPGLLLMVLGSIINPGHRAHGHINYTFQPPAVVRSFHISAYRAHALCSQALGH